MAEVKEIKSLLKEAQLYQDQGLLKEAKKRYESAVELVEGNSQLSLTEKEQILISVLKQIQSLDEVTYRVEKKTNITEISPRDRDLIKRLFSGTPTNDRDNSMLEGAVALAKFGQFDRAITEFEDLIEDSPLRIVAAKHILRCHMAMRALHDPVLKFQKWMTAGYFAEEELAELSTFLERTYGLSATEQESPPPPRSDETAPLPGWGAQQNDSEENESPPETSKFDPYEDEYVDVLGGMDDGASEKKVEAVKENAPVQSGGAEGFIDIIGGAKKKQTNRYDDINNDATEDYVDYISSVGFTLANGKEVNIPVNLQTGSIANLIIPGNQKALMDRLKKDARLESVMLNSPISVNIGSCTVVSVTRIDMGPKKGDYSVDLKIEA